MARPSSSSVRATKWWSAFELACLALAAATAVLGVSAAPPSAADLAHCPKSCGGTNFSYPFGIGRIPTLSARADAPKVYTADLAAMHVVLRD
ncbi:unnamed protein product [Urochloa humidicola]